MAHHPGNGLSPRSSLVAALRRDRYLYLFLVPVVFYYLVFRYVPMGGLAIAFEDYRMSTGVWGSPWVGLAHFRKLFQSREFLNVLWNTVFLNVYGLIAGFPVPIILAILLNEVHNLPFKKTVQVLIYLPHFISWVILGGIVINLLSPNTGIVNHVLKAVTGRTVFFLGDSAWWPTVYVFSGIWASAGWGTIVYLAAITCIDPQLYEAAVIDGAGKLRQVLSITLPCIAPTIMIILILRLGNMLSIGFEQVFMLQNVAVRGVSEVISTYVYRIGIEGFRYSYTTALGVFQSIVGFAMVLGANALSRRITGGGIW